MAESIRYDISTDRAVHTITLDHEPGNIIDIAMCGELRSAIAAAASDRRGKVLVVRGAGAHFSFGASVEEHLPDVAPRMLAALGGVIRDLVGFPYPTVAAVQGRCLGGGLELVMACGIVIAAQDAILANPEIQLGVIAPAATALFTGRGAEDLLLTGRSFTAERASAMGIVNEIVTADRLDEAVETFVEDHFAPRSASSLRIATAAVRTRRAEEVERLLDEAERVYLEELLATHDGSEGIRAFLDKRRPVWSDG